MQRALEFIASSPAALADGATAAKSVRKPLAAGAAEAAGSSEAFSQRLGHALQKQQETPSTGEKTGKPVKTPHKTSAQTAAYPAESSEPSASETTTDVETPNRLDLPAETSDTANEPQPEGTTDAPDDASLPLSGDPALTLPVMLLAASPLPTVLPTPFAPALETPAGALSASQPAEAALPALPGTDAKPLPTASPNSFGPAFALQAPPVEPQAVSPEKTTGETQPQAGDSLTEALPASLPPSLSSSLLPSLPDAKNRVPATSVPGEVAASPVMPQMASVLGAETKAARSTSSPASESQLSLLTDIQQHLQAMGGRLESLAAESDRRDGQNEAFESGSPNETPASAMSADLAATAPALAALGGLPNAPIASPAEGPLAPFAPPAGPPTEQVAEGAVYAMKNGHRELIIRLNPDNLGEVKINLMSHAGRELTARLIASTPESHELLKSQADALRSSLEAKGVQVEHISVVLAGSAEASGQQSQARQDFANPQHSQHSPGQQPSQHQQHQAQQDAFAQLAGQFQQKSPFAQQPSGARGASTAAGPDHLADSASERPGLRNDHGQLSILA